MINKKYSEKDILAVIDLDVESDIYSNNYQNMINGEEEFYKLYRKFILEFLKIAVSFKENIDALPLFFDFSRQEAIFLSTSLKEDELLIHKKKEIEGRSSSISLHFLFLFIEKSQDLKKDLIFSLIAGKR